jgi:acyl dehydratase
VRYWQDFRVGEVTDLGTVDVTEEELLAFARRYDPQPFHVDPEAARDTPFGGLIASGWHTAALFMSLYARTMLADAASLGSPGVEELRWWEPVRPGDRLGGRVTVVDAWPSSTTPGRGTVVIDGELFNQEGTRVLSLRARGFFARR